MILLPSPSLTSLRPTLLKKPESYLGVAAVFAPGVLILKAAAYYAAGGAGFLSDASESLLNLLTVAVGTYGAFLARQPRDQEHPYGHGKVDDLISALQALLVAAGGIFLGYTILMGRFERLQFAPRALLFNSLALGNNLLLSAFLYRGSKRFQSHILRSEAWHLFSDVLSSLLVLVGTVGVWMGWPNFIDRAIGLLLSVFIVWGAVRLVRRSALRLIDTQDKVLLTELGKALEAHRRPGWIDVHNVRIQRYGPNLHIDGHVTFPWYWSLQKAHTELKELEQILEKALGGRVEFFWHMDPCEEVCCPYCEMRDCKYRKAPSTRRLPFTLDTLYPNQKGFR